MNYGRRLQLSVLSLLSLMSSQASHSNVPVDRKLNLCLSTLGFHRQRLAVSYAYPLVSVGSCSFLVLCIHSYSCIRVVSCIHPSVRSNCCYGLLLSIVSFSAPCLVYNNVLRYAHRSCFLLLRLSLVGRARLLADAL